MDQINKVLLIWLVGFMVITAVIAIHLVNASTELIDPRDPDSLLSCDDEICKAGLIIAAMDETLKISNSTSLLVFPKLP